MRETLDDDAAAAGPPRRLWRVSVVVLPKTGVNDPEGESILGGLHGLGFGEVRRARAGRHFAIDIAADSGEAAAARAGLMAERLLANPVIERYAIERVEPLGDGE